MEGVAQTRDYPDFVIILKVTLPLLGIVSTFIKKTVPLLPKLVSSLFQAYF